jgi:hypothetical protein
MQPSTITTAIAALDKAKQLVEIATDWNLDEVEIDGEMVRTRSLTEVFDAAIADLTAMQQAPTVAPRWTEAQVRNALGYDDVPIYMVNYEKAVALCLRIIGHYEAWLHLDEQDAPPA